MEPNQIRLRMENIMRPAPTTLQQQHIAPNISFEAKNRRYPKILERVGTNMKNKGMYK
jgi:hypothetical protein